MDYVKFFGLACEPFQNDLDGRFYFEGSAQRRARQYLLRAVQQRKGLALLLGGPGLGKTTLAHQLLRELDAQKFAAHLLVSSHRECARDWFLPQLARAYGLTEVPARVPELIARIHEQLLAVRLAGRHPVLFVDEAQLLGEPRTLEEFRALLNLAHDGQRLFSLVLFGMEELGGVLALDPSLAQRVDVRAQLRAFSAAETGAYLAHRLTRAGGAADLLSPGAVDALHRYSGGVLRVLNTLADNALFEASLEECRALGAEHVIAAAQQLQLEPRAVSATDELAAGEAASSFQVATAQAVASRRAAPVGAPQPEPEASAADEPLFGESTAETLGRAPVEEDWLEPVAPVLDAVMRSFDDDAATEIAPPEAAATVVNLRAADAPAPDADPDDPLGWSLVEVGADADETEAGAAETDDDSLADLAFGDEDGEDDAPAAPGDDEEIDLGDEDLAELVLEPAEESATARGAKAGAAHAKGPRIDLPEDDDLDSLFDEIQIES